MKIGDAFVCKACGEIVQPGWTVCPGCDACLADTGMAVPVRVYLSHFFEEDRA